MSEPRILGELVKKWRDNANVLDGRNPEREETLEECADDLEETFAAQPEGAGEALTPDELEERIRSIHAHVIQPDSQIGFLLERLDEARRALKGGGK